MGLKQTTSQVSLESGAPVRGGWRGLAMGRWRSKLGKLGKSHHWSGLVRQVGTEPVVGPCISSLGRQVRHRASLLSSVHAACTFPHGEATKVTSQSSLPHLGQPGCAGMSPQSRPMFSASSAGVEKIWHVVPWATSSCEKSLRKGVVRLAGWNAPPGCGDSEQSGGALSASLGLGSGTAEVGVATWKSSCRTCRCE